MNIPYLNIEYPHDVERLKEEIDELKWVPDHLVQQMYRDYSDQYCASWLILVENRIDSFRRWLK